MQELKNEIPISPELTEEQIERFKEMIRLIHERYKEEPLIEFIWRDK